MKNIAHLKISEKRYLQVDENSLLFRVTELHMDLLTLKKLISSAIRASLRGFQMVESIFSALVQIDNNQVVC